jgi:hypothetical protein
MTVLRCSPVARTLTMLFSPLGISPVATAEMAHPHLTLVRIETATPDRPDRVSAATDLCVTSIKKDDRAAAARACDHAIAEARFAWAISNTSFFHDDGRQDLLIAYNNRAVLRYVSGAFELAAADARRAQAAAAGLPAVRETWAVIDAALRRLDSTTKANAATP